MSEQLHVLALDLSITATGVVGTEPWERRTIKPKTVGDYRLAEIADRLEHLSFRCDLVIMEDLPMGMRNAAAGALGMLHGAVRVMLISTQRPYLTIPPASLKKYATSRGNAPKPDMRMELYKRTEMDLADDNQVDAMWLWLMALDLAGQPLVQLPKTHRVALDSPHIRAQLGRVGLSTVGG